jgi:hypothetical protein
MALFYDPTTNTIATLGDFTGTVTATLGDFMQTMTTTLGSITEVQEVSVEQALSNRYTLGGVQDALEAMRGSLGGARDAIETLVLQVQVVQCTLDSLVTLATVGLLVWALRGCWCRPRPPPATVVVDATPLGVAEKV